MCRSACPPVYFNPRTPVGCDDRSARRGTMDDISIHAPQWGATAVSAALPLTRSNFNPRTPVGCDAFASNATAQTNTFQSTHPSGVRPESRRSVDAVPDISIHAPQWGATRRGVEAGQHQSISIHAPQWGATSGIRSRPRSMMYFNPRTPVGCDMPRSKTTSTTRHFNPRTPVGCDANRADTTRPATVFQSTHPSGVRPSLKAYAGVC